MYSYLHAAQSGFRPRHTTQDVLVSMVDDWKSIFPSPLALKLALLELKEGDIELKLGFDI